MFGYFKNGPRLNSLGTVLTKRLLLQIRQNMINTEQNVITESVMPKNLLLFHNDPSSMFIQPHSWLNPTL